MKRTVIIFGIFLIVHTLCFGQNRKALSHFWDIPWGISMEQAEKILNDRGLTFFRSENTLMTQSSYEREEAAILLVFNKANRFYCGNVIYSSSENSAIKKYENYRIVLFRRYGMPTTSVAYFAVPYEKGDGREIEAISTENAFYFTEWLFHDNNQASVSILKNLDVCLSFKNPVFADSGIGRR
jgi:hypothetical protein